MTAAMSVLSVLAPCPRAGRIECLLNACSEVGRLQNRSVCSVLDCFLFPSRNSSRCDANLRAAL